jgi:hypothetical protein
MRRLFSHPFGWLFYLAAAFFVALGATQAHAQSGPALTTITDVVYRADGSAAGGSLVISWPAFTTADGKAVAADQLTVTLASGGALIVQLAPNEGASPEGTYYKVVYQLDDGTTSTEYWMVSSATPATVGAIRATVVPRSVAAQFATRAYVDSAVSAAGAGASVLLAPASSQAVTQPTGTELDVERTDGTASPAPVLTNISAVERAVRTVASASGNQDYATHQAWMVHSAGGTNNDNNDGSIPKTPFEAASVLGWHQGAGEAYGANTSAYCHSRGDCIASINQSYCYGLAINGGDEGCEGARFAMYQTDAVAGFTISSVAAGTPSGARLNAAFTSQDVSWIGLDRWIVRADGQTSVTVAGISGAPPVVTTSAAHGFALGSANGGYCFMLANSTHGGYEHWIPTRSFLTTTTFNLDFQSIGSDQGYASWGEALSGAAKIGVCGKVNGKGAGFVNVASAQSLWTAAASATQPLGYSPMAYTGVNVVTSAHVAPVFRSYAFASENLGVPLTAVLGAPNWGNSYHAAGWFDTAWTSDAVGFHFNSTPAVAMIRDYDSTAMVKNLWQPTDGGNGVKNVIWWDATSHNGGTDSSAVWTNWNSAKLQSGTWTSPGQNIGDTTPPNVVKAANLLTSSGLDLIGNNVMATGTNDLNLGTNDSAVKWVVKTTSGNLLPQNNVIQNIGAAGARVATGYVSELNMAMLANNDNLILGTRATDTSPLGTFETFRTADGLTNLWSVDVGGTLQSGAIPLARLNATGTASSATFLRGDGAWSAVSSNRATTASTTDTLTCSAIGANTETAFATTQTIAANTLLAGVTYNDYAWFYQQIPASPGTLRLKLHAGGAAAPILYDSAAQTPTAGASNSTGYVGGALSGTAAAGASVNVISALTGVNAPQGGSRSNTVSEPVSGVATNAGIALTWTLTCGAATASESVTLLTHQLVQ